MELLMQNAARSASAGASVARRRVRSRPRRFPLAASVSIVVHGALVAAALAIPARRVLDDDRVTVDILAEPAVAPPAPAEPPPKPPVARPVVIKRARPVEAPVPMPAAAPPQEQPEPDPTPPVASAPTTETSQDPRAVLVATAPAGAGVSGGGPGSVGLTGGRGPVGPSESQRRNIADRYRDELLRTRIREHFRYPAEARELELTGRVVVQVTVDRNGRLLAARLAGSCPHRLLCEDGLRTIRASAPFPALPADLGDSLKIEIPLKYDFQ
jgi:periplasmic protein TonB